MKTETLSLVISGDGARLGAELGKSERNVKTFSGRVGGMFTGVGKKITGAVGKLSPWAMVGGTAGIMMAARDLIDYQDTLSSLGITAGLTTEEMMSLDQKIHNLAYTTGQSREKLVAALRSMTSDVDTEFAVEAIENVGKASTAMSFDIEETAKAFVAFRRDMGATNEEAAALFNTMMTMNQSLPVDRLANAVSSLGITKDNLAQYNAFIHTVKNHVGGEDRAAAMIERVVTDARTKKSIQYKIGAELFDTDGKIKDFRLFIQRVSKMTEEQRQKRFGPQHSKVFTPFARGDGFKVFDDFIADAQEAGFVTDAFTRKQREAKFQLNTLTTAAKEFAGAGLSPILSDLTAKLRELTGNPAAMEKFRNNLTCVAETVGHIGKAVGWVAKGVQGYGDFWEYTGSNGALNAEWGKVPKEIRRELEKKTRAHARRS
jgi:hypothetical protein